MKQATIMKEYLFSYGTLQNEKVQIDLFGRSLAGSADVLRGYKVSIIEITDETFLSKGEGKYQKTLVSSANEDDIVRGTVFEITRDELLKADGYEPGNYKRTKVVESGKKVWIYVATGDDGK